MLTFLYCSNSENLIDIVNSHLKFNSKHRKKDKFALKLIPFATTSNVFSLEFVNIVVFVYYGKTRMANRTSCWGNGTTRGRNACDQPSLLNVKMSQHNLNLISINPFCRIIMVTHIFSYDWKYLFLIDHHYKTISEQHKLSYLIQFLLNGL